MLFDENGTGIFLGTSIAEGSPLTGVWGEGEELYHNSIKIAIDEDDQFIGVYGTDENGNEVIMSPDQWNSSFKELPVWDGQKGRSDYPNEQNGKTANSAKKISNRVRN